MDDTAMGFIFVVALGACLLALAIAVIDKRWKVKSAPDMHRHTTPLADEVIWAKVDQRMAAGNMTGGFVAARQSQELTELRADRALLQAENQVLRGELERVKRELEEARQDVVGLYGVPRA
jgi:hypothetical protein